MTAIAEPSVAPRKPRRWLKNIGRTVLGIALAGISFMVLVAISSSQETSTQDLLSWQAIAGGVRRWGLLGQCLALALVFVCWRTIVGWAYRLGLVKRHELKWALRKRRTALAWGVLYLLLVPIGPTTLWNLLVS